MQSGKSLKSIHDFYKVIAVDFDGTITEDIPYPLHAEIRPEAKVYIKKLYELGFTLVLWTARKEADYAECLQRLKDAGLYEYFDFSYADCGHTGKIRAYFYIDDRSCRKLDWQEVYDYIIKTTRQEEN